MPRVLIPTPLRPYADNQRDLTCGGATVGEALVDLAARYDGLRRHVFDERGEVRSYVSLFKNDEDVRLLAGTATPLDDNDTLTIVPSIAGGAVEPALERPRAAAPPDTSLSHDEIRRYSRHLILPEVGLAGQKRLKEARVVCVGAGGLGSPLLLYLAAAGVGTIGVVDFDSVDDSNLQRQVLYSTADRGRPKLEAAAERLRGLNAHVRIVPHSERLTSHNALDILRPYDVVADGTDNFPTRYLVNDACVLLGKPNVHASIFRFEGQASVFWAEKGPCYRCLFPAPPPPGLVPSCAEGGVLGILPGLLGVLQASETIKLILGIGEPLVGRLLLVDALGPTFRQLKLRKDAECAVCGPHPSIRELVDYEVFCGLDHAPAEGGNALPTLTVEELKGKLDRGEAPLVLDVREPHEVEIVRFQGSLHVPLNALRENLHRLSDATEIVVHCKLGGRSAQAVRLLQDAGFRKVWNLAGGIDRWAEQVDPSLPRY